MTKSQLRIEYLAKRRQLTGDEYALLNNGLLKQFQQLDLTEVNTIHLFLPIIENNEPNTHLIRNSLKETQPHIKVVFPKTDFATLRMKSYADDTELIIEKNSYNIPEPVSGNEVGIYQIDMVILPMLVFDEQGYRVGYGKGFYDRFCAQCKPGIKFIGLSLFDAVKCIQDVNQYDVRMHACLTPTGNWDWNK
ncbi:5-formyltetrahydrofolate cyclo-ligase [Mucilaginibacter myungsuensis]|uniref:5-formyltetrahydrofolate cyclo-ligase n=1 Tax=Mucilaginibacter myungsuensis TaxID=649104 RepID=A0A929KXB5_9SPHI|nr:5-formyltetrahydrofolate cyclo-ligase [Mucilaginibacter myungsuensis]MBE9663369.1 5-formyltetrahydrofolate cyclo-ligase [Mucilaginibacter myungsuensis]MDN3600106.1 5-formyltetrahydrofolate cyclo-ligase [Mucilaginibacter myungsuensis]